MFHSTLLSQKGQVVLPKTLRDAQRWQPGTRLYVQTTPEGLLLTAAAPVKTGDPRAVAECAAYRGTKRSVEEMTDAIRRGVAERHARR